MVWATTPPNLPSHGLPGGRGRKRGVWLRASQPAEKHTSQAARRLQGSTPRAESGKAFWVPGKKGPSEISGTVLARASACVLSGGCLRRLNGSYSSAKVKAEASNNRGASRSSTHTQTRARACLHVYKHPRTDPTSHTHVGSDQDSTGR